jgi:predicted HicB family RNase H-like nuclease
MILEHKGYLANVSYETGDDLMHGVVINNRAVLYFAGRNIKELRKAFADTIIEYLKLCSERGLDPEKPYSGSSDCV